MINVTERAKQVLRRILTAHVDLPQGRLRLMYRGRGKWGLGIDIEAPGDRVLEYEGTKVLVIESELANTLQGLTIDVDDTPDGPELVVAEKAA